LVLAALGFRTLSMRAPSVGPVKHLLRRVDLGQLRGVIAGARAEGAANLRPAVSAWLADRA
jgi:phosphotransferase system enzyme I (PtsP)